MSITPSEFMSAVGFHFGSKAFVLDRDSPYFEREALDDLEEDGRVVWAEDTRPNFSGSGSYEEKDH
jgi:hypothetical protein